MNIFKFCCVLALAALMAVGQGGPTPISIENLRDLIPLRSEEQAINLVSDRKVSFPATEANLNMLRDAGATEKLIAAVVRVAPKPPTGTLRLRCSPGDCTVRVGQQPAESSQGGQFNKAELALGETAIAVSKEGYVPQQLRATISQNAPVDLSVTLIPTEETKVENGRKLLDLSLEALGIAGNVAKLNSFNAKGSFISYAPKQRDFQMELQARGPATLQLKVSTTKGESLQLVCDGEACGAPGRGISLFGLGGGKKLPKDVSEEIDPNIRRFPRYGLTALLRVLESPGVKLSADSAEPAGANTKEQHLFVDQIDGSYDYTLSPDLVPSTVTYSTKTGLGASVTMTFAAYVDIGNGARYPQRTTIKAGDVGIQVNLDTLEAVKP